MAEDNLEVCRKSAKILNILNSDGTDLQLAGEMSSPQYIMYSQHRTAAVWNPLKDLDQRWLCEKYLNENGWMVQTLPGTPRKNMAAHAKHGARVFDCPLLEFPARLVASLDG